MSQPQHPDADLIAGLLDGSMPAAEAMAVNAHLAGCPDCRDVRDALLDVTAVLAEVGTATWMMPADVAASLDAAIAGAVAERPAPVRELDPVRRPRTRRPIRWLAGAAAVAAVVGIGLAGWEAMVGGGGNATSAAGPSGRQPANDTQAATQPAHTFAGPTIHGSNFRGIVPVRVAQVPMVARSLAAHPATRVPPSSAHCADPVDSGIATVILWHGHHAVLDVLPATRTATVLDCATAVESLYTTGY